MEPSDGAAAGFEESIATSRRSPAMLRHLGQETKRLLGILMPGIGLYDSRRAAGVSTHTPHG